MKTEILHIESYVPEERIRILAIRNMAQIKIRMLPSFRGHLSQN